jgi:hypothetical protein
LGKFQTQKLKRASSPKSCGHLLEKTFVLRFFRILSADGRASASNVEKRPIKSKFFSILKIFPKVEIQKLNVCACLTRLVKPVKKKITLDIL